MGLYAVYISARIVQDNVKLRGSVRTSRLRKKRLKHLEELYIFYRDELFSRRHGLSYIQWRRQYVS